ncbi:patatin-like phospholipase family protein [Pseudoalteromonas sp. G4]|uniref:patatin-like phospholipase family protein n=1 Tax=Pseudoalteromonas sp. G4 TaxID=2992761 RepID=UPI00237DD22F|nr:patatin-like phospholipase family protein [Pseudoalteromonas sp. G4]MDE3270496.1 patatin-like phospholipase family protein [Pseudoalteromonas sp. G4]
MNKKVSLILGSGGARGLAHIGVINALNEHNFEICSISGCSIGALIGGIYAAGKLPEFEKWILTIDKYDIVSLLDLAWGNNGLVKGDKIINTLKTMVDDLTIEELPMPYTAVASDILNGKEVWLNSGPLFDAIRASISLPLFFTPVERNGKVLIDGGVLNPVPIAPTFNDDTDLKLAVNLGSELAMPPEPIEKPLVHSESSAISRFIASLKFDKEEKEVNKLGAYEVADKAFDAMQSHLAAAKLAAYPPDVLVEISRTACGTLEFDKAAEMIALGYKTCIKALKDNYLI